MSDQGDGGSPSSFMYVWSYEVVSENRDAFLDLYGPDGQWVALFRLATGYVDTQLLVDLNEVGRFITIDRWASKEAFTGFRTEFAKEFNLLDALGERLTSRETPLGEFGAV